MALDHLRRRALMRRIWRLNVESEEGRWRLQHFGAPWLVENFYRPELAHLPDHELRISFPDRRFASDLPFWERVQRFRQSIPHLFREACLAREMAMSYRDFNVGTALLAFRGGVSASEAWRVFRGMNTKHAPNMRPTCSEPIAINGAYAEGYSLVIGMVIVGELREEDIGRILTLHPCRDCRWLMHGHSIIDEHTLVLTTFPREHMLGYYSAKLPSRQGASLGQKPMYEIRTVAQLLRLHQRISGDDFS